jgi:hypothetical protein
MKRAAAFSAARRLALAASHATGRLVEKWPRYRGGTLCQRRVGGQSGPIHTSGTRADKNDRRTHQEISQFIVGKLRTLRGRRLRDGRHRAGRRCHGPSGDNNCVAIRLDRHRKPAGAAEKAGIKRLNCVGIDHAAVG